MKGHTKPNVVRRARPSSFAANFLQEWRRLELPVSDATIIVAVSGGADSSALLLALEELIRFEKLQLSLVVAHLDHGLRKESRSDAEWVSELTRSLSLELRTARANLKQSLKKGIKTSTGKPERNIEQAARNA